MDKIRIIGGNRLNGKVSISGSKNSSLPIMISSILTDDVLQIHNVPELTDIKTLTFILEELGASINQIRVKKSDLSAPISINVANISSTTAGYENVSKMRASFLVIGALLAREGYARVSMPGGCAIGTRPVDIHLKGLKTLGADVKVEKGFVIVKAKKGLTGNYIQLEKPSVGATQNLIMASTLAKGETKISNASIEPEVLDLIDCLKKMGANIEINKKNILIDGQETLHGASHSVMSDRIEAATFAIAACITRGNLILKGCDPRNLELPLYLLRNIGFQIKDTDDGINVDGYLTNEIKPIDLITEPYPGFPTDLQAQFMALLTQAHGVSVINEKIFENRFMHVQELVRMGADIYLDGDKAIITGKANLVGAQVMATDLRASVSLVIAALCAEGETLINRVYHLDRGFENLEKKLSNCGAEIERIR